MSRAHSEALVVGTGVMGLCAAWWLAKRGLEVTILEQFQLGHDRGSSHGSSRITRSSYHDPVFARMMVQAHGQSWPALARDLRRELIVPTPGLFFGPRGGFVDHHEAAAKAAGSAVKPVARAEAQARFPQFNLDGMEALVDETAGVVNAKATIEGLIGWLKAQPRVRIVEHCKVTAIDPARNEVLSEGASYSADHLVVCAGSWAGKLVPRLETALTPVRQTVAFVRLDEPPQVERPVWIYLGHSLEEQWYGLPDIERGCWKLARHRVSGAADDPDVDDREGVGLSDWSSLEATAEIEEFLAVRFRSAVVERIAVERCLYTNTDDEDFVLDHLPGHPWGVIGGGCSGHAFKFGPLIGQILAELVLEGKTNVPAFEEARERFKIGG